MKKKSYDLQTICAISTPPGNGAISIIRISGPKVHNIINKFFSKKHYEHRKVYTQILRYNKEKIDKVNWIYFQKPHSYTGENMLEIHCHGSVALQNKILQILIKEGIELAKPGEFTLRSIENGKMNLLEGEEINELINIDNEKGLNALNKLRFGNFEQKWEELKKTIISIKAKIEAAIDFSDNDDISKDLTIQAKKELEKIFEQIKEWEMSYTVGKILKNGYHLAILGKPNVGKSSLLNTLLKDDRAIVTDYEGTTRDIVKEELKLRGYKIFLYDTAGIRKTENLIEKIGIEKVKKLLNNIDGIILIFDISTPFDDNDRNLLTLLRQWKKDIIVFFNKNDIKKYEYKKYIKSNFPIVEGSLKTKEGLSILLDHIFSLLEQRSNSFDYIFYTQRQKQILKHIRILLSKIKKMDFWHEADEIAYYFDELLDYFAELTGEQIDIENIRDYIFNNFCIGK